MIFGKYSNAALIQKRYIRKVIIVAKSNIDRNSIEVHDPCHSSLDGREEAGVKTIVPQKEKRLRET